MPKETAQTCKLSGWLQRGQSIGLRTSKHVWLPITQDTRGLATSPLDDHLKSHLTCIYLTVRDWKRRAVQRSFGLIELPWVRMNINVRDPPYKLRYHPVRGHHRRPGEIAEKMDFGMNWDAKSLTLGKHPPSGKEKVGFKALVIREFSILR